MEEQAPRFGGEVVKLGGREYAIPSLSVKQARTLWPKIKQLQQGVTEDSLPDRMGIAVEVVHAALSRNYPDIKIDEVEDLLDMNDFRRIVLVVTGQGVRQTPGAEPAATEAATT